MIVQLYDRLGGAVSVYTLEQRGTGRSSPLTCGNSASSTPELTQCLRSLHVQYKGNFAAFSVTSAAFDLVTIISQTQASADVVVYGLGFGTLVVERLLHFGVAPIKGYVLDSSATASGAGEFAFASQSDAEFGVVSGNFLALCEKDEQCSAKFPAATSSSSDSGNSSATPLRFTYARDKYWNVGTTIPAHASVLLLSGKLDGQYPLRHAQLVADGMLGAAKKLVVFEIGTHNDILQSSASSDNSGRSSCGLEILGSYIRNRGALDRLDASCLEKEPTTPDFRITESVSLQLLGVMDAYASVTGNSSLSDAKNGSSSGGAGETFTFDERADLERSLKLYRAAFFVALGVLAIVALVAVVLLYRWWKSKQLHDEETQLRRMRGEEPDDLELLRHIYMSSPEFWGSTVGGQRARGRSWGGDLEGGKEESKSARSDAADKSFSLDWEHSGERSEPPASGAWVFRSNHLQL